MSDTIPTDLFSRRRREMSDNPGALGSGSTIHVRDFYGNAETWVVETLRVDGSETAFIQRNAADGGMRLVLPPEVMAAMRRHQDSNERRARRRGARQALETKRAKGQQIGNPDALRKARRVRRRK